MDTAFSFQQAILWLMPVMLLASAAAGWVLATKLHRRRLVGPSPCQRACCSPARVDGLDHREFEYLIRDLMIRDGADKVKRVGGAGDNGADVIAVDPTGQRWIIQCKHRKQGLAGAPVGVREFQILNGTGRPVHKGHVVVMVTNGAVTRRARGFAQDQDLHVIDRFLLEDWIETDRPVWELLAITPRSHATSAVSAPKPVADMVFDPTLGSGSNEQQGVLYTLADAYEAGFVPWKPTTMRQYLVRSQRRGIPLPRSTWDGQAHHFTEEQLRTWLGNWQAKAGPNSKVHELPSE
ncbi:restriction endonuclease (plasmid) [Streptomyces albidoflavus]|uniref:restriction endonuclease n=1 Tax=Streptomyces albidoflavus TaxID=1886 RepID=UPI003873AFB2|nr:restriction endonuclease [Streptomyces albidoflavus]